MRIWTDCSGSVITTELALVASMVVAGVAAGMATLTDALNSEMADLSNAIESIDQSYVYGGIQSPDARTAGSGFIDYQPPLTVAQPTCTVFGE